MCPPRSRCSPVSSALRPVQYLQISKVSTSALGSADPTWERKALQFLFLAPFCSLQADVGQLPFSYCHSQLGRRLRFQVEHHLRLGCHSPAPFSKVHCLVGPWHVKQLPAATLISQQGQGSPAPLGPQRESQSTGLHSGVPQAAWPPALSGEPFITLLYAVLSSGAGSAHVTGLPPG